MEIDSVPEKQNDAGLVEDSGKGSRLVGRISRADALTGLQKLGVGNYLFPLHAQLLLELLHVHQPHQPFRLRVRHRILSIPPVAAAAAAGGAAEVAGSGSGFGPGGIDKKTTLKTKVWDLSNIQIIE
ncbi:NADH-quinone oxidoreductase subunit C [Striga asiatica]|uniref:NADH-quinone oxidoreductase subunit C n=1 Tax=Striga asiatica TaxID=4170 RepID=A0A5A7RA43_STRAF|nr:NADH-quinone oxidoreductase subunit C [Striga asiatica]